MATAITEPARRIANRDRLIFALDVPDLKGAKELVTRLGDSVAFYKIGLELATSRHYFELLDWLIERDKKVFTDLKLYDIPATVSAAVRQLSRSGASFLTVHGDRAIMEAAALAKGEHLKILVVTVLTSIAPSDLAAMGIDLSVEELVLKRALQAAAAGCDGVRRPTARRHADARVSLGRRPHRRRQAHSRRCRSVSSRHGNSMPSFSRSAIS